MSDEGELGFQGKDNASTPPPKRDMAGDAGYDGSKLKQQETDENLIKLRWGRWAAFFTMVTLGILTIAFFWISACFAFKFVDIYQMHIHSWAKNHKSDGVMSVAPLVVPMMPAFLFSVTGLLTLITTARFITSYICDQNNEDEYNVLGRLIRDVVGAIKSLKPGQ